MADTSTSKRRRLGPADVSDNDLQKLDGKELFGRRYVRLLGKPRWEIDKWVVLAQVGSSLALVEISLWDSGI